ncbi:lipopolysaccharide biosynthesis protein [Vibrio sp. FNV 38]|nr:lipopolysaccharide biosynthesis protein [Vibrio sp. FNV 38]
MNEEKFQQFRKSITPTQFRSIEFLTKKAKQIESEDPALAKRILFRVRNLKSQQKPSEKKSKVEKGQLSKSTEDENTKGKSKTEIADKTDSGASDKAASKKGSIEKQDTLTTLWCKLKKSPFIMLVVIPTLVFAFYQVFWATERFESQAKVTVQQPDGTATMDASMAILSGLGVSNTTTSDTELIKTFIYSNDMLQYLEQAISLRQHFSDPSIDVFSRLSEGSSQEELLEYYLKHVLVEVNDKSGVVSIYAQAFTPEFSEQLAKHIVERAEWYINSIGHQLAEAQLEFIRGEHQLVEDKLNQAQSALLTFQNQYNLLDPTAEGMAMQQIAYQIEGQISVKEAELKGLQAVMSASAPRVMATENELSALRKQLEIERERLAHTGEESRSVSEILATFTDFKIKVELALQAYTSSQISLEKSRIEAYRQLKYLVVVETSTLPQDSKYPDVFYNITLFLILAAMLFTIGRIVQSTIKELK